ncbi:PREDICTED: pentatricopeptide repeat-containing protein At4g21300 [Tarenaya hassleriana]|uniref:pentatricopeptide repeat-containing protein At4g21300 n=1 Tax=Tarenaya hassleriana TaxID=28532 RepID=UPI00053C1FA8|nr:PREDICTED: pentatricopeptide repeat-containing protein At4g21300 [Tarenaya hassleriana]XP_010538075.1 PREDICTED: pentatricopeptide repeat-containing protein At4g21300 [Tarenaya hassleriana]XP_010538084.1 PREDICTED: pentatricopeptide repeat-containing protein At4g21300 [Tarenaya hassleriana]XP_010538094.1 PREDICTED: pentatricopeptide repeat-containing protein At4g21300 [Tarenaya hassleriana]XP_010538103.1 PREDICTED: pentatricopeptide repeat-containing protein At4g21300 [Tarenaya hassleriana]
MFQFSIHLWAHTSPSFVVSSRVIFCPNNLPPFRRPSPAKFAVSGDQCFDLQEIECKFAHSGQRDRQLFEYLIVLEQIMLIDGSLVTKCLQMNLSLVFNRFPLVMVRCKSFSTSARKLFPESLPRRLASFLQACSDSTLLGQGKQVHAFLIVNRNAGVSYMDARILGMYAMCGSFEDAGKLFYSLDLRHCMAWNSIMSSFVRMGFFNHALSFYFKMLSYEVCPDESTFPCLIKACIALNNVRGVGFLHHSASSLGMDSNAFVASSLIKAYTDYGQIGEASKLFDKVHQKDCVIWNVMLKAYAQCGASDKVIDGFGAMRMTEIKPNAVTFDHILSVCASKSLIGLGVQLHGVMVVSGLDFDVSVNNSLLSMYSKCRQFADASKLFRLMSRADIVTWNCMISGYVQNGLMEESLFLFHEMVSSGVLPDAITLSSFLPSVAEFGKMEHCREIHGYILRHGILLDIFLISALIDAYFKCKGIEMARKIFRQCTSVDIVVCTTMISGYLHNGMNADALEMFRWLFTEKMSPNDITLVTILPVIAGLLALNLGSELHAYIIKEGSNGRCNVGCALMDMYAKCGRMDIAYEIFRRMPERDSVCWNSMITRYAQSDNPREAIDIFREMGLSGAKYDYVSISAALSTCANLPAQHHGKEIHGFITKHQIADVHAESALIDMYAKCGNLDSARHVFEMMREKNEVSWNSIIAAYGNHGLLKDALFLFHKMVENGIQPDQITFLAIISACGHVGAVDEGVHYFESMTEGYGIPAQMEHYACMVDLFGRAGRLNEAFETIKSMPFPADAGVWGTLLGACRVHRNVELAKVASSNLLDLDPQNSGYYVLLSNTHADAGHWENVLSVRNLMKERGVRKIPGCSWIEVNKTTHAFVAAEGSHPQSGQVYSLLKLLLEELKREGYIPQPYLPMHPQTLRVSAHRLSCPDS